MNSRPIHFEIHASDVERAVKFYGDAFGWTFEDWTDFAGMPYFGVVTGRRARPVSTEPSPPGMGTHPWSALR